MNQIEEKIIETTASSPQQEEKKINRTRLILAIAWPIVLLETLNFVNELLDNFFVGHLETSALTGLGASFNIHIFVLAMGFSVHAAAVALISRAYGKGDVQEMEKAGKQVFSVSIYLGLALAIIGYFASPLLSNFLLPAKDVQAKQYMILYCRFLFAALPAFLSVQGLGGALIGRGNTKSVAIFAVVQVFFHVILNYFLIMDGLTFTVPFNISFTLPGLGLGVLGAGISFLLSYMIAAVAFLYWGVHSSLQYKFSFKLPDFSWARRILIIAWPAIVTWTVRIASYIGLTKVLTTVPTASIAIASTRVSFAIETLMFAPILGFGIAASTLVGQNLGKQNPKEASKFGWHASHIAAIVTLVLAGLLFINAESAAHMIIHNKPAVAEHITIYIKWICATEAIFAYAVVLMFSMQGAGDTRTPLWLTLIWFLFFRVPFAWLLASKLGYGANGVWIAMAITQALQGFATMGSFKRGKWKTVKV